MKHCGKALIALFLIGLLVVPATGFAQGMPLPVERAVLPGVTTIQYAGQTFVFTTSVALKVRFEASSQTQFEMSVRSLAGGHPGAGASPSSGGLEEIVIDWKDFNQVVLDGDSSKLPWDGLFGTEGGWTEK